MYLFLLIMYVSPAFIDKSICNRLNIWSCKYCDNLRMDFSHWKLWQKRRTREQLGDRYRCNPKKCTGLIATSFLQKNHCNIKNEIRLTRGVTREDKIATLLKRDPKFIPHCIVTENPHKRRRISRREVMYKPTEKLFSAGL